MQELEQKIQMGKPAGPEIGGEDWRYTFATARVRVLETQMLDRATLVDMANAESYAAAADLLSGTDYPITSQTHFPDDFEQILLEKRSELRATFVGLMLDEPLVELLRAREDFANMRLAVRRVLTERPIGTDYSEWGDVPAEEFEEIFENEDYSRFPNYLQEGVERAVLAYYENKDIRQIDYALDKYQVEYKLQTACELGSVFLMSLFMTQADLINIRMMIRLISAGREDRNLFVLGGFVTEETFLQGLDMGLEGLAGLFYASPYNWIIEQGVNYLHGEQSFLRLEKLCEDYIMDFLNGTVVITAGPQPVIAYLLKKESEIRTVRMILTGKRNGLDSQYMLDRLGEH